MFARVEAWNPFVLDQVPRFLSKWNPVLLDYGFFLCTLLITEAKYQHSSSAICHWIANCKIVFKFGFRYTNQAT